jgi:protein ImuA
MPSPAGTAAPLLVDAPFMMAAPAIITAPDSRTALERLRARIAAATPHAPRGPGVPGQLEAGALHEIFAAAGTDCAAASGFAALSALSVARGRPMLWVRHEALDAETGLLHAPGLVELGLDPGCIALVRVRNAAEALKAADEAVRCAGLGAVMIDLQGESARLDLTATRRLALGAQATGVTAILTRIAATPAPGAAATRWQVKALASRGLEARAPGPPAFAVTLLRDRAGGMERQWQLEWNRDQNRFEQRGPTPDVAGAAPPLPVFVAAVPAHRQGEAAA